MYWRQVVLILLLFGTGCSSVDHTTQSANEVDDPKTSTPVRPRDFDLVVYQDQRMEFQIGFPQDWTVEPNPSGPLAVKAIHPITGLNVNVIFSDSGPARPAPPIAPVVQDFESNAGGVYEEFEHLDTFDVIVDRQIGKRVDLRGTKERLPVESAVVVASSRRSMVVLTFTAAADEFAQHDALFKAIIESFQFPFGH